MDLLNEEQTAFAKKRLIQALDNYGWRLGTGFLSTPLILYVLADMDIEYAYRLLENEEIPGWLFMPKAGAKTIWEGWEGPKSDSGICSLNHYSKGAVCEWLFDTCCGLRVDGETTSPLRPGPAVIWQKPASGMTASMVSFPAAGNRWTKKRYSALPFLRAALQQ